MMNNYGAHGAGRVQTLALQPLTMTLLQVTRRNVVDDGVAKDMLQRALARNIRAPSSDNNSQFHLIVEAVSQVGIPVNIRSVPYDGGRRFREELDRFRKRIGRLAPGKIPFNNMLAIIT